MSLQESTNLYENLLKTIKKFKSPVFKTYFNARAKEDYNSLVKEIDSGKFTCAIKKYMDSQKELLDVLKRQTVIYNMYYDKNSNI